MSPRCPTSPRSRIDRELRGVVSIGCRVGAGLLAILAAAGCGSGDHSDRDLIRRTRIAQQNVDQSQTSAVDAAPDAPSDDGRADGLPPELKDMLVRRYGADDHWFVGVAADRGAVEIPFRPGTSVQTPDEPSDSSTNQPSVHRDGVTAESPFIGPDACRECHAERHGRASQTAHFRTSQPAGPDTIIDDVGTSGRTVATSEPGLQFRVYQNGDHVYQGVDYFGWRFEIPMNVIIGSSRMAQSYLYWHNNELYQHNLCCLSEGSRWINSPGFVDGDAIYARPIEARCLDCHTTSFDYLGDAVSPSKNRYDPHAIIWGVTCERCHGPGRDHVTYHRQNPDAQNARRIVNPADLSRGAQLDICGQCHQGDTPIKGDALTYRPGDPLRDHYVFADDNGDRTDSVHTSNQRSRLARSGCFTATEMTCTTCHNPHQRAEGGMRAASQSCIACHADDGCSHESSIADLDRTANCIDCHMPLRRSESFKFETSESAVFPHFRDHHIRVDREATASFEKQYAIP